MERDLYLYKTATGDYWLPDSPSDHLLSTIKNNQVFDRELVDTMVDMIRPGDVVLDVGSNFGQTAILLSHAVGDTGVVHGFEAEPWIYKAFCQNIRQNRRRNIIPHFGAVWDSDDMVLFYPKDDLETYESHGSYGIDPNASTGYEVSSITIDGLGLDRVDLIKIDVQGADLAVLRGCKQTIKKHHPRIIFEYEPMFDQRFNNTWEDYLSFINDVDYKISKIISLVNVLIEPIERTASNDG